MRLTQLLGALVLAAASSLLVRSAMAQTQTAPSSPQVVPFPRIPSTEAEPSGFEPIRLETLPEAMNRAFFSEGGDYYDTRTIPGQVQYIFGIGAPGRAAFPDLQIERAGELINMVYNEALEAQASAGPLIRTPDLPNPYSTTLLQAPGPLPYRSSRSRVEGSEFIFDTVPPR